MVVVGMPVQSAMTCATCSCPTSACNKAPSRCKLDNSATLRARLWEGSLEWSGAKSGANPWAASAGSSSSPVSSGNAARRLTIWSTSAFCCSHACCSCAIRSETSAPLASSAVTRRGLGSRPARASRRNCVSSAVICICSCSSAVRRRGGSANAVATRALAVSSTSMALSGNWRPDR
ncbi:hypothetical protein D3C87_1615450 [compost metagenome]